MYGWAVQSWLLCALTTDQTHTNQSVHHTCVGSVTRRLDAASPSLTLPRRDMSNKTDLSERAVSTIVTIAPPRVLTSDGGWCWFESPRALQHNHWLLIGSVSSGHTQSARHGSVELLVHNTADSSSTVVTLHANFELDDHDCPALHYRSSDSCYLATWAKHGTENTRYYRLSLPDDPLHWQPILTYIPSPSTQLTYSNLFSLSAERLLYDFYRGLHGSFKPSYSTSADEGSTWRTGNVVIDVPLQFKHRPYVRYASDGVDTVHLVYSEAHPRDYDNSLYHVYYRAGQLHRSDGTVIAPLTAGLSSPDLGTLIYRGDSQHVAWPVDCALVDGRLVVAYSVQYDSAGLPVGQGGDDIRYRYATLDPHTKRWHDQHFAYAGGRLYSGEDDYSGLVAIEPTRPHRLYISTNAHPLTGVALTSKADGRRHWELWAGRREEVAEGSGDDSIKWMWQQVTVDSVRDNLRPIRPTRVGGVGVAGGDDENVLVWLRGEYRTWIDYTQEIVMTRVSWK